MTSVNVPDTVLAKIAADQSHSTTDFLVNNRTIFVQTELRIPLLRQKWDLVDNLFEMITS